MLYKWIKISAYGNLKDGLLTAYVVSTVLNEFKCGAVGCFPIVFSEWGWSPIYVAHTWQ